MNNAEKLNDERSNFSNNHNNDNDNEDNDGLKEESIADSNASEYSRSSEGNERIKNKFTFKKDDKVIVCWNCQSLLILLEEAEYAKCDKCRSINKVPDTNFFGNKDDFVSENENNFNVQVPFMFILVNCPFCHTENRARKDSDLVVCFVCYNSFSVFKEKSNHNKNYNSDSNNTNTFNPNNNHFSPLNHIIPVIQSDLENRENYLRNQSNKNNAILNYMANNINNMMGNYVNYSKNYIDENLNKFTNDILNPIVDKYKPLLQENIELMSKMNANFEKYKRFERMYLSDKLQLPAKRLNKNFPINHNPNAIRGDNYTNGNDYNSELRNRIKSSNFNGSLGNRGFNYDKNQVGNNLMNYERKTYDPVFGEVNNRNFRTADHSIKNRQGIDLNEDEYSNVNYNYPRVYSFDENGKLVKNVASPNNYY